MKLGNGTGNANFELVCMNEQMQKKIAQVEAGAHKVSFCCVHGLDFCGSV